MKERGSPLIEGRDVAGWRFCEEGQRKTLTVKVPQLRDVKWRQEGDVREPGEGDSTP